MFSGIAAENTKNTAGPNEKLYVFLLIGQSNMAGRAPIGDEDRAPIERCYLLNASDEWEIASNPLNRYSRYRKEMSMQKLNPGYTFAKKILRSDPSITVGLVVNARGGTSISQWSRGGLLYSEAVRRVKIAQKTGVLKGILWHQGEADCSDPLYLDKLKVLIGNFREDLGAPDLPFIAGQINGSWPVNDQIARLPREVPCTGFASSEGLNVLDDWHFDTPGMRIFGERYADAVLPFLGKKQQRTVK
ncbi:sialate O-acetylesterase [bacterium]|nr:sialate O-acetylesterase [bacterium]